MLTKDKAICIRVVDYSETSQIATFFTRENGKIDIIAKGSKRPKSSFGGPLEIFSCGQILFTYAPSKKLATLTEFEQLDDYSHISTDLFTYNCSLLAAELLNNLTTEYNPQTNLFDSFLEFLRNIKQIQDVLLSLILFQLTLLKELGLQPVLNKCTNCRCSYSDNWPKVYFSSLANGLLCRDCEANFPDRSQISKTVANCLSDLKSITKANQNTLKEIEKLLIHHFTEILNHRPKMAKYVLKEMKI